MHLLCIPIDKAVVEKADTKRIGTGIFKLIQLWTLWSYIPWGSYSHEEGPEAMTAYTRGCEHYGGPYAWLLHCLATWYRFIRDPRKKAPSTTKVKAPLLHHSLVSSTQPLESIQIPRSIDTRINIVMTDDTPNSVFVNQTWSKTPSRIISGSYLTIETMLLQVRQGLTLKEISANPV